MANNYKRLLLALNVDDMLDYLNKETEISIKKRTLFRRLKEFREKKRISTTNLTVAELLEFLDLLKQNY
jgi:hypothetical protein